jgi:hypothetical protein
VFLSIVGNKQYYYLSIINFLNSIIIKKINLRQRKEMNSSKINVLLDKEWWMIVEMILTKIKRKKNNLIQIF